MSKQTLNAKVRTASGKTAAKKLRQVGSIPAVMYNEKGESTMLEVNEVEFIRSPVCLPISESPASCVTTRMTGNSC